MQDADLPEKLAPPRIMVLGLGERDHVAQEAARLRPFFEANAEIVAWDLTFTHDLTDIDAELAVVLGGDGSIMRAVHQMGTQQRPVMGVNFGKLGFLASMSPAELCGHWPAVAARNYRVVVCVMLECQVLLHDKVVARQWCLNEVAVIGAGFAMVHVELFVDDEHVTTYSCDGLLLSTPVGSTAHNLSAGGPILRQDLDAVVISPLSPHALTMRPVVDRADRVYELRVPQPKPGTSVVVDGQAICELTSEHRVRVQKAPATFRVVRLPGHSYYRTLREKLNWGGTLTG